MGDSLGISSGAVRKFSGDWWGANCSPCAQFIFPIKNACGNCNLSVYYDFHCLILNTSELYARLLRSAASLYWADRCRRGNYRGSNREFYSNAFERKELTNTIRLFYDGDCTSTALAKSLIYLVLWYRFFIFGSPKAHSLNKIAFRNYSHQAPLFNNRQRSNIMFP